MMERRTIVYIDGFNLYFGICDKGWRRHLWLDVHGFARSLVGRASTVTEVKYFTSRISGPPDKVARQTAIIDAQHADVQFFYGNYRNNRSVCSECRHELVKPQEKGTDVNIAAHMLADAFLDRYDEAVLVSGDMDLLPALKMIREHHPTKRIVVAYPPSRVTAGLKAAAHSHVFVGEGQLASNQLPDPVVTVRGHEIAKPHSWR